MHFVELSDDDYAYLIDYCAVFGGTVDSVLHRRIEILRSAVSFGARLAMNIVDEPPSDSLKSLIVACDDSRLLSDSTI